MSTPASAQKALASIISLINATPPDYYSAHQKARTSASRMSKPMASKKPDFQGAIAVLFESSRELLKRGEQGSANDLAMYMIDMFELSGTTLGDLERAQITQLIALTGEEGSWRKMLLDRIFSWSSKIGPYPSGDPELHQYAGELYYREGAFSLAEHHFLYAATRDAARSFGQMMAEWYLSTQDSRTSAGTFAAHGVLPYLIIGSISAALSFINAFTSTLSSHSSPLIISTKPVQNSKDITVTSDSGLNFLQFVVLACQRGQQDKSRAVREAWVRLCGTYQSRGGLASEPEVRRALQEIGFLYFAMPPPRGAANPLGDMMASLLGGGPGGAPAAPPRRLIPPGMGNEEAGLD